MSDDIKPTTPELRFRYRNWKGEIAWRWVAPRLVRWGATEFHPEPQWLLEAYDLDKGADRTFALKDVRQWHHNCDWKALLELPWVLPGPARTTWTHDIPEDPMMLETVLHRLRQTDGRDYDCAVIGWAKCQALVREIDRLKERADRYHDALYRIDFCGADWPEAAKIAREAIADAH